MNKILLYIPLCMLFGLISCDTDMDNYSEPNETLTGKVIDAATGQPLLTEQPNGFQIRYKEIGYSTEAPDRYFWGKADGTYQHTKLFANQYEITVVNGPFIQSETKVIDIKGVTELDFTVTPYLNISGSDIALNGDVLTVKFTINRPPAVTSKLNSAFIAIDWNPNVGNAVNKIKETINYSATNDSDILGIPQTIQVDLKDLKKGYTYYVRIGACTDTNTSRYNYSEVLEFDY